MTDVVQPHNLKETFKAEMGYDQPRNDLILMLEGLAVTKGVWLFNEIRTHHGEKAASFVKVHSVEDIEHIAEAEKAMRLLPEKERPLVIDQIASSGHHYCAMLAQCGLAASGPS